MKDYSNCINENLQCIEDLGMVGKNHMLKVKCLVCENTYSMRSYQFDKNEHTCLKKYVGKTNGVLTCVEDLGLIGEERKRRLLKVECSRCGGYSVVRSDRFIPTYTPKSCSNCTNSLQKEIADSKYLESRHFRKRLHSIIGNAKSRGISFELSDDEVAQLLLQHCYYCNDSIADGIDRIDSSKGYTKENVVPCCKVCNIMKNKFTTETFLDKVNKIYNKFFIKSSTTISKESTLQANGNGSGGILERECDIV